MQMNKKAFITKEFGFEAAHKLDWHSGKCKNLHGHSYKIEITISGEINKNGVVMDFSDFKKIAQEKAIEKLDHKYLNEIISNPTAENIAVWIWQQLKEDLNLHEVRVWETESNSAIYRG